MEEPPRLPSVDPSAALADLALLPFLSLSPYPSLVLRVGPLIDALRHRQSYPVPPSSPLRSATTTYNPRPGPSSEGPLDDRPGPKGEPSVDVLPSLEQLSMKTPSARVGLSAADDYFSLRNGDGVDASERDIATMRLYANGLAPAWKNTAWRDGLQVVDGGKGQEGKLTRSSSIAQGDSTLPSPTYDNSINLAAAASAAARNLRETFARMHEGMDDRDVTMRERLGTVHEGSEEDDEDMDTPSAANVYHGNDDYEPDGGVETWRASWNFLSSVEQASLFSWLLDFLEQLESSRAETLANGQRRPSTADSAAERIDASSTSSILNEDDDGALPGPALNSTLRLPGLHFTAVPTPVDPMNGSRSPQFIVISTPPLVEASRRLSEQFRSQRHPSTSSSVSLSTPGPSLLQRQRQEGSIACFKSSPVPRRSSDDADFAMAGDPWFESLGSSEMAVRIKEHAWSKTELGPLSEWPVSLRTTISSIIASPFRECILWGQNKLIIYNDRYIETAGLKHPDLLGTSARECWAELWDELEPVANRALQGETVSFHDHFLTMERDGFLEETYHSFTYAPLRDGGSGDVVGILNLSNESTAAVVASRRLSTVRDLIHHTSLARTVEEFATSAMKAIAKNPYDVPFAILYHVDEIQSKPTTKEIRAGKTTSERKLIKLSCKGSVGVSHDHPFLVHEAFCDLTPARSRNSSSSSASTATTSSSSATAMDIRDRLIDSSSSTASSTPPGRTSSPQARAKPAWTWPFEEACLKRETVQVDDLGDLVDSLDERGWDTRPKSAIVIPIRIDTEASAPSAVIVLGVNPMAKRLAENPLMKTFFDLISRHIAIGLFAVLAAEQDRRRAEELLSLDRAKSSFFSSVSHDLRTPLTLILSPLGDLLEPAQRRLLHPNHAEKLVLVQKSATRLLNMVNKLLDFSSVENGRMSFRFTPVRIGNLTRELASLFVDAMEKAGIDYTLECDEDPADAQPIYLSPDLWEKIMMNILGNALKYTQRGSIAVKLKSTRGEAVLSVKDSGVGIPRDELGNIFERFHRVQSSSRATAMSTGIGLALTLELVKLIGGQLEVESELGVGSIFTVRLSRGYSHLPIEQVDHQSSESITYSAGRNLSVVEEAAGWRLDTLADSPSATPSAATPSAALSRPPPSASSQHSGSGSGEDYLGSEDVLSLKNRTIVLVDDSRDLRNYMSSLLSTQFTVVPFSSPIDALEYIKTAPPSLLVTDSMMPGMSGMELTREIRSDPRVSLLPIIMVSAQAGSEAKAEALEGGLDDYLVKPFPPRELVARARIHVQLGLMRVELEKRVEERTRALIESESRNRALAERYSTLSTVSPVGIVQISQERDLVYANPAWFDISGHNPDAPLSAWKEDVVAEHLPKLDRLWKSVVEDGQAVDVPDRQFLFKSGKWAQLEIRASTEVGLPAGWVGALTDITQQKKIEELHIRTVEERMREVEENRRQMEDFLDFSSHENRNPLSGVWQNAEVVSASLEKYVELLDDLRDGHLPPSEELEALHDEMVENTDAMESILLCTAHQGRIADDILNVSKLNMGLLTINLVPFELVPRMIEVKRMFEAECSQKQIDLRLLAGKSVNELGSQWISADPARLHQILLNFLSNSIKYTTDIPHRKITIRIDAYPSQPAERPGVMRVSHAPPIESPNVVWIVVGVEDNGKGLNEEELLKLFARFSQANPRSDQVRYPTSSGLGLYISKKLVELHSGFIEVESRQGVGSVFSFAIPAQKAHPQIAAASPPLSSVPIGAGARTTKRPLTSPVPSEISRSFKNTKTGPGPSSPAPPVLPPPPIKVLVVEDNLVNQKILCRQLKNAGYETQVANNGLEALEAFEKDALTDRLIKICLCDIQMPVLDGLSAVRILRRKEREGEIPRRYPCIAVTGNARAGQQEECLQAGFDFVLSKPYTFSKVVERIEALKLVD
ncbi:uncharacterized protein JCM15063_001133 [Sporobolomyces koalae]|uniref:uncharacterized protein n=1 Tax=Sporobolomyces koalae TaxID=500713 RepID=UPI00318015F4